MNATLYETVVIGAGPAGIAAGVKLKKAGISDFAILERADAVGGSWRDNTSPGIGVDVPELAYQYSFARNPRWSRALPKGEEVRAYHEDVAHRSGLYDHLVFNTAVEREVWDDDAGVWELHTDGGAIIRARFVISAVGAFLRPKQDPGIPGLASFRDARRGPGPTGSYLDTRLGSQACDPRGRPRRLACLPALRGQPGRRRADRRSTDPDFGPVVKRPTLTNLFLKSFNRENVSLVTTPIERITKAGILRADGIEHPLDMIVLATGYELFSDEPLDPRT